MSWLSRNTAAKLALAGLLLAGASGAGCTVRPLYAESGAAALSDPQAGAALSTVSVAPVTTRDAQEVRNHLIFLLGGGKGQPATPRYTATLFVSTLSEASANIQISTDEEPTAATITMTAVYSLIDTATGQAVRQGRQQILSSYDVPRQEFAVLRAQRDAENRAARELAELLRLAIAQDLVKLGPAAAVALK
jgi:LPS-assembly lipoprotein